MMLALVLAAGGLVGAESAVETDVSQVVPYFSENMVHIEAEDFTPAPGAGWAKKKWGDDGGFFASTVANTFGATEIQKNFISGTRRRKISAAAVPPADRVSDAPKGRANSSYCAVGSRM